MSAAAPAGEVGRTRVDRGLSATRRWLSRRDVWLALLAFSMLLAAYLSLLAPMLQDFTTYGFHDWDVVTAYRYITVVSLRDYAEGPWWHPWLCGGVPAWGHVETATNLVSPYLPLYLWADVRTALRLEVVGGGLLGLAGCYVLAARFTDSVALRALLPVLFVLNGRWALQAAVGHSWHLQYGFTPWVFFFFDRAHRDGKSGEALLAGASLALMCYMGGIYPLPQTALLLSCYALLMAALERDVRPLQVLLVTGVSALGFAAPKLLAVADHMQRVPRYIDSNEVIGLAELVVMLTDPTQRYGSRPVFVPAYNWHEWGLYVGLGGLVALVLPVLFGRGARENALKICGLLCLLLGFGKFHAYAPWTLLHELPVFASQHVPSRYHYLMVFFLGLGCVALAARWLGPLLKRHWWVDLVLLAAVALLALDLVGVNQVPFAQAFWMRAPEHIERAAPFEHRTHAPVAYERADWAAPMLLSMFANTGVIDCYGVDPTFRPGAVGADHPSYRGRVYLASGPGRAELVDWSPNRARVQVTSARAGSLVAYNMNYDPSWRANGEPALDLDGVVAARVSAPDASIEFRYFPRSFSYSIPIFLLTLALALGWLRWLRRRARSQAVA